MLHHLKWPWTEGCIIKASLCRLYFIISPGHETMCSPSFIHVPFHPVLIPFRSKCVRGYIKARKKLFFRTFIITLVFSQDLPHFLNTVENWSLNPLTLHKIFAVKILKEPRLGFRERKITRTLKNECRLNYYTWHKHLLCVRWSLTTEKATIFQVVSSESNWTRMGLWSQLVPGSSKLPGLHYLPTSNYFP